MPVARSSWNLDHHCPVDLLEDRTAETVAAWLQAHPEVTVVARDRAEAYASGVAQGAPEAVQVADRWHLVKHLREAIEAELRAHPPLPWYPPSTPAEGSPTGARPSLSPADPGPMYPDTPTGRRADTARQARRTQRLGQYEQACALRQQGLSMARIARHVGVSLRTLSRWYAAKTFPERTRRTGESSCLDPYTPILHQYWEAGCHNATHLWHTLRAQGFPGSYAVITGQILVSLKPLRQCAFSSFLLCPLTVISRNPPRHRVSMSEQEPDSSHYERDVYVKAPCPQTLRASRGLLRFQSIGWHRFCFSFVPPSSWHA